MERRGDALLPTLPRAGV
jgi:hypothetical protein